MASWEPTERVLVPSAQQGWDALTFLHFPYDPALVASLLPPPFEPQVFDGRAWIGVTPFRLLASVLPVAPGPRRAYVEVNVRTYVRHRDGRDGVWFLSLELDQAGVVTALRLATGLPYRRSDTRIVERGDEVTYGAERRRPHRAGGFELTVRVGKTVPAPPSELEIFLVGRWLAFTGRSGWLRCVPVHHRPWPLHRAELISWRSDGFLAHLGIPEPAPQDAHVLFSPGVHARLGFPRP